MPAGARVAGAQVVRVVIDTTYYRVEGRTRREWQASWTINGPRAGLSSTAIATTGWKVRWSPGPLTLTPAGCVASAPEVGVTIHYKMPHLVPAPETSSDDVREWRRYLESIWRHEEGHGIRALREGVEMRDSLNWMRAPTCVELQRRLSSSLGAVREKYNALQDAYDVRHKADHRLGNVVLPRTGLWVDTTFPDTLP